MPQDIVQAQVNKGHLNALTASDLMHPCLLWLQPSDSLWLAHNEMQQQQLPCLPVVDEEHGLLGVVSHTTLLHNHDIRELSRSLTHLWETFQGDKAATSTLWNHLNVDLVRLVQTRTQQIEEQAKSDRILTTLTQKIHQSLDLMATLSVAVTEVRHLLQTDAVRVIQFDAAMVGTVVMESVAAPALAHSGATLREPDFTTYWANDQRPNQIQTIEDTTQTNTLFANLTIWQQLAARAVLVVPIVGDRGLWGLLVVQQCYHARHWQYWEIRLMKHLMQSLAIAIRQSELYQQLQSELAERKRYEAHLQQLNNELEAKVEARTASLKDVSDQLQAVLDAVPGMVAWVSADLTYLGCNQYLAAAFGRQPSDFIGQPIGFIEPAAQLSTIAHDFFASDVVTASQAIKLTRAGEAKSYLVVSQKYQQGHAAIFIGIDISDREKTERALQASETKFRSLVEQINDWVWEMDARSCFIYASPRAREILGYSPEDLIGKQFADFMTANEAIRFATIRSHVMQQRQPFEQVETTCLHQAGHAVVLEISGAPIFTPEGTLQGYRGIARDITERKQVEINIRKAFTKEKELSELKTRFISMASHEFRTPLTTILASAESLDRYRHKFPEEKQKVILKRIQTSVHHLMDLLSDILTVGKAEAGKLVCKPEPLDLKQFCLDLVEELHASQSPPITTIHFQCDVATCDLQADEKLLRHVLINLLSNAVKYSPEATSVDFELSRTEHQITLRVSDRGIGIAEADQDRLFEAFHRGNNVGNIAGNGLGLVIAKRAVEAHQGTISCVSQVGHGTTFTVVLPVNPRSEAHG